MVEHSPILHQLLELDLLTLDQAEAIIEEHHVQGNKIRSIILEEAYLTEEHYLIAVAQLLDCPIRKLTDYSIPPAISATIPAGIARLYHVAPVQQETDCITVAVSDYPDPIMSDDLAFVLPLPVRYVVATSDEITAAISSIYGTEFLQTEDSLSASELDAIDLNDPEEAAHTTPVIRFVNLVLHQAVKDRASDIHFEPFEKEFKIRYRVDGALFEMEPPPHNLALPVISRVKVISGLDIAESRLPQDGRIQLEVAGRAIDFRVSTLPTQHGESVVLRVLDRATVRLDIEHIGFPDDIHDYFLEDIKKPNGIVIVTGPTGSGKTTTLYAALQHINQIDTKILTAEDPVEYDVEGIIQLPINDRIGLTFDSALRSFLRQDPDIIMVGEIRDLDTAQIAIQASLTGHLVFSTLHTNDAAGAITRLIDMDVEPYLIASSLEAVMGQRLVRTICTACRQAYQPDSEVLDLLELEQSQIREQPFYRGEGCSECNQTGYLGRRALFEYMRINDELRAAIIDRLPTTRIRQIAIGQGMRTLRENGIRCILDGCTTVEEVIQYT